MPGDGPPLDVRAPDHVYEVDMAVAGAGLNVAPSPLSPVVSVLVIAEIEFFPIFGLRHYR